jgi:SAM-dependent methyltransferase
MSAISNTEINRRAYDKIAADWHKDHLADDWWNRGTDAFVALLPPGATVLDAGCGTGVKSKYLSDRGFKVVGFDLSEKMIEIARAEVPDAEFFVHDLYNIDTIQGEFDAVFMQASLLHVDKERAGEVIKKAATKVKSDGFLYIAVKGMRDGKGEEVVTENDYGYEYERYFSYYSLEELKAYFGNVGFDIVYTDEYEAGSKWIQIIGKKHA